ncbi:hypothetical protein Bbelb_352610 [Branchiostoma belcheri]|nr:hypothetical protein Bbelb_352610 [Branchiostoma belcheri]
MLYKAIVLPILEYCDVIWDNSSSTLKRRLQILQNRAARIILRRDPRANVEELHQTLQWEEECVLQAFFEYVAKVFDVSPRTPSVVRGGAPSGVLNVKDCSRVEKNRKSSILASCSRRHTCRSGNKECRVLFTTAAVDNIDHNPSSTTAKDSFHGTAISLLQHPNSAEDGERQSPSFELLMSHGLGGHTRSQQQLFTYFSGKPMNLKSQTEVKEPPSPNYES